MKLTVKSTAGLTLPAGKREAIFFDDEVPGLGLRLREGGSRTWIFQYKLGVKQRRMALGSATAIDPAMVRDGYRDEDGRKHLGARQLYARVKNGDDPASDKADAKVRAAETFKATVDKYLEHQRARLRPRSYPDLERHLVKHAKVLHGIPMAKIDRRDVAIVIAAVAENSGTVTANRVRTSLSSFFTWAMKRGIADMNPVIGTERNKEHSRERVLEASELRAIWNTLPEDHFGSIIKLLALTGQRAGEIAGLRWSEIQGDTIALSADRTKNHRAHVIPLSAPARAILDRQPHRANAAGRARDLIFGMGDGPFSGWSNSKERLDAGIAEALGQPIPHWTPHDLRRTAATRMVELGIQPHVVEAVLNHVSGHKAGVAGIYNRSSYEREKRSALDLWAEHLLAIVEGRDSNVTVLKRA